MIALNQREERMDKLIQIGYRSVDLDRKEPRMRHFETMQQLVDSIEREERLVDLNPTGEMLVDLDPTGEMVDDQFERKYRVDDQFQRKYRAILNADTREEKMTVVKQEVYLCNCCSFQGFLSLAPIFLPCAGGTGHGSGQPEHQGHSEIYPSTLNVVSNCPSPREYMQRAFTKCADVCGSYMQDGNCAYHCMRDSSKTKLVEFCAKPKPLFDFCPEYDPVDQTIQKDLATLCNSTSSRNYYNSSDIYFCDPNNCLQLRESSVRSGATTLTTLINETTEMSGGYNQEWFLPLTFVLVALILAITIGCSLFYTAHIRKMTEKRNQNGKHTEEIKTLGGSELLLF